MFVRLTKKDGTPIWLNANLIVTVEAVRNGGSIVVPVGDGLDYEVRESVERVIPMVEEAQDGSPVLPIPSTDALVPSPEPVPELEAAPEAASAPAPEEPPAKPDFVAPADAPETSEAEAANAVAAVASIKAAMEPPAEEKPSKRTRKAKAKPAPPGKSATEGERKLPARRRASARRTPLELSAEQIDRLRSMAPRTIKKILNTLKAQFKVSDAEMTVKALVENGIISVDDHERATWLPAANA